MKTILITGANRGIGLEFARQYLQAGCRVLACCRNPESASELKALSESGQLTLHPLDICKPDSVAQLARELAAFTIDTLINNAGIYGERLPLGQLDYANWQKVLETNTLGPIRLTEALLEQVSRAKEPKLIYITSKMGSIADNTSGGGYIYRSSKAALNMAVKSVSQDVASRGILAAVLHPGWVQTDMGGSNALISPNESVTQMRRVIEGLEANNSGRFYNFDGKEIPW